MLQIHWLKNVYCTWTCMLINDIGQSEQPLSEQDTIIAIYEDEL